MFHLYITAFFSIQDEIKHVAKHTSASLNKYFLFHKFHPGDGEKQVNPQRIIKYSAVPYTSMKRQSFS